MPAGDGDTLPTDFVITFSEQVRGQNIELTVVGFADGANVFSGTSAATADHDEAEIIVDFCGDEEIDDLRQEECDDGAANSDTAPDSCRTSCLFAFCGDGVLDAGETCDDGSNNSDANSDACRTSCEPASCGDGAVDTSEECDDGATNSDTTPDACRVDCASPSCGDGVKDSNEQCDDGDNVNDDGCDADCIPTAAIQVSASFGFTCAVLRSGALRCWGLNFLGQLGYGNTIDVGDDEFPSSAGDVPVGGSVIQVSTATNVVDAGANIRCWGTSNVGQLGYANTITIGDNEGPPNTIVQVGGTVLSVDASDESTCALLNTGKVRCWGRSNFGQLGYINTTTIGDDETPSVAGDINIGGTVVQISAGAQHTCALLDTGKVRCWGRGLFGRLGYGNEIDIGDTEPPASAGDVPVF